MDQLIVNRILIALCTIVGLKFGWELYMQYSYTYHADAIRFLPFMAGLFLLFLCIAILQFKNSNKCQALYTLLILVVYCVSIMSSPKHIPALMLAASCFNIAVLFVAGLRRKK
jgi:peptidoglycan/LPS O-acetylase OafA/YrhL